MTKINEWYFIDVLVEENRKNWVKFYDLIGNETACNYNSLQKNKVEKLANVYITPLSFKLFFNFITAKSTLTMTKQRHVSKNVRTLRSNS